MANQTQVTSSIYKLFSISRICKPPSQQKKFPTFFKPPFFRQPRVQTHLKNVYTCLLAASFCATLGTFLSINGWFDYPRLAVFASIITSVWLFATELNARTEMQCFALMAATAFCTGIYLNPLIQMAIDINPQIVMTAFLLTTLIFLCFTLSALLTSKRSYLYLGGRENEDIPVFEK